MVLNESQRTAAEYGIGDSRLPAPLLIIAGAGHRQDNDACPPRSAPGFKRNRSPAHLAADFHPARSGRHGALPGSSAKHATHLKELRQVSLLMTSFAFG